ncbi:MAG: hypothetical protein F4X77_00395 [Acidobacteriia bacterium]|nr:hypothetical protein [Terriglobia bacterium]
MPRNPALQVRLPASAFERLAYLRTKRHLNVSAWAREVLLDALERDFAEPHTNLATPRGDGRLATSNSLDPLPGWRPARLPGSGWGAACDNPENLPAQLVGLPIRITPRQSPPWIATVVEVIRCDADRVLVRHTGRPDRNA